MASRCAGLVMRPPIRLSRGRRSRVSAPWKPPPGACRVADGSLPSAGHTPIGSVKVRRRSVNRPITMGPERSMVYDLATGDSGHSQQGHR